MKHLKNIGAIILSLLLTFCTSLKSENSTSVEKLITEMSSTWSQVYYKTEDLRLDDQNSIIKSVQLINDSIAEVQIKDSIGERKITGTWKFKFNEMKGPTIEIKSDIDITYLQTDNNPYELNIRYGNKSEKLSRIPIIFINEN